jgi:hypothetical protein
MQSPLETRVQVLRNTRRFEELRMDYFKNSISTLDSCARIAPSLLALALSPPALAVDRFHKLAGPQIAATLAGMQFTNEVHWREVYETDGTLRRYAMGRAHLGTWRVRGSEMCIDFGNDGDKNCFEVWRRDNQVIMQRDAEDNDPIQGRLEKPGDAAPAVAGGTP